MSTVKCVKNLSMREVLYCLLLLSTAVQGMQDRALFYSFMSFKAGLEQKLERDIEQICFRRQNAINSGQTCSRFDSQIERLMKSQKSDMFSNVKNIHSKFVLGLPHGPAQIELQGGKQVFTQFRLGQVEGLVLTFDISSLVKVLFVNKGNTERTWSFSESGLITIEYADSDKQLVLFEFEEEVFAAGRTKECDDYSSVKLGKRFMKNDFLIPVFNIIERDTFLGTKHSNFEEGYIAIWFKVLSKRKKENIVKNNENLRQNMGVFKSLRK